MAERPKNEQFVRPHALIISDDESLSGFLGEGLVFGGFWTSVIASEIQALEVFRLRGFDLVIVDAALRGLGALEMIRRLRSADDSPGVRADAPILLIAEGPDEMNRETAVRAGADDLL